MTRLMRLARVAFVEKLVVVMTMAVLMWATLSSVGAFVFAQEKPVVEPVFTEVQTLKLQLFDQQMQTIQAQRVLLQQAETEVRRNRAELLAAVEKDHPGWTVNRETLKWEKVPLPASKK